MKTNSHHKRRKTTEARDG